jgi:heterodisulfide reductase subunit A
MDDHFLHESTLKPAAVLVVGGGIGGMRAALDLADAGLKVYLVEQTSCLGGRVAQLGFMFPQHDCVLCRGTPDHGYGCTRPSISPAYLQNNQHPNISILTNTQVIGVEGQAGDFSVLLRQEPRYVDLARCINCDLCAQVCQVELPNEYQDGLTLRKAAYKVAARAAPDVYVIDRGPYCDPCGQCARACPTHAINLDESAHFSTIEVGAMILALGFDVYDPVQQEELGYRRYSNVLKAMQYERLASRSGPTEGIVIRPSDGQPPHSIAWLQCIGSRDQKNQFCSSICCMYATKEAILAKQRLGEMVECSVFIMDERAFNKEYSAYFTRARETHGISYQRCRVSEIREEPGTKNLILKFADPDGHLHQEIYEMVVLATGLQPPQSANELSELLDIELNQYGFCQTDKFTPLQTTRPGVFVCGAFSSPKEIVETIIDASGAAAEVMRLLNDRLHTFRYTRAWPFLSTDGFPPERDVSKEPMRTGVFICSCAGTISSDIDLQALNRKAISFPGVVHSEIVQTACLPEALDAFEASIQALQLNRVVVAACSNRTHESLFQRIARKAGLNPYLVEVVNIREQCTRVHRQQDQVRNMKAVEAIRMAVGRVQFASPIHKDLHPCLPAALVIGGGVAGMTAALAIADSGYDVHLVERSERLGGNLLDLYYVAEGYNPQLLLRDLVNRVRAHQRINIHTRTELIRQEGHVGRFTTELLSNRKATSPERIMIEHGVTVVATGGYESQDHPWLKIPRVITQRQLEDKIIHHPQEIAALKDVVMIQCVRSGDQAEYCSRVCCTNTMKNAIRLRLFNPKCRVKVLFKNIVTYGFREEYYREALRQGVIFLRYTDQEPPQIQQDEGGLVVRVHDLTLDRWLWLPADLVTLSMTIAPARGTAQLAEILRVPVSSEGFFQEAQLKLRPMDFMREGIFLAGMAHYPKFIEESISHALAAAARALTLLSQETLYLGGIIAQVDPDKCVGCLTCTRICPFEIPRIVHIEGRSGVGGLGGAAYIDPAQCQGCGTCTAECPANAITLVNYTDQQMFLREIHGLGSWQHQSSGVLEGL